MSIKINVSETVLVGNFAGDDAEQSAAASKYCSLMTKKCDEFLLGLYPDADIKITFETDSASGSNSGIDISVDSDDFNQVLKITNEIEYTITEFFPESIEYEIYE